MEGRLIRFGGGGGGMSCCSAWRFVSAWEGVFAIVEVRKRPKIIRMIKALREY